MHLLLIAMHLQLIARHLLLIAMHLLLVANIVTTGFVFFPISTTLSSFHTAGLCRIPSAAAQDLCKHFGLSRLFF